MPHPNVFRFEQHPEARAFPCTTLEAIAAMSQRLGLRVLTDWAAFLLAHNGYDFNTVTKGEPLKAPFKYVETAVYMFGVGTGFEFNDIDAVMRETTTLQRPYRALLTPIGMCSSGDLLVQITAGPQLGAIARVDHNVQLSLAPDDFERQTRRSLADPDSGAVVDLLIRLGLLIVLAPSLSGFLDLLVVEAESDGTVLNVQISAGE